MKAKLNSYLVGGGDVPMKFVKAASPEEAVKVWAAKTGLEKKAPAIAQVKPTRAKAARPPKKKEQGGEA